MLLKARLLEFEAKKPIAILDRDDAEELGVKTLDRLEIKFRGKKSTTIVNIAEKIVQEGEIGLSTEVQEELDIKRETSVDVRPAEHPESLIYIKKRLDGEFLKPKEIRTIIKDTVDHKLSDIELTAFVTSLYNHCMSMSEIASLSKAMADTGEMLVFKNRVCFDKHSIGGVPGDKTSIIVVPIIAAAGLTIPKTSSRAITSPAGTADRFECIAPVELKIDEVKKVVEKTNGCIVWGGSVNLAPADDIFIQIEYPLSIDPFLLPSVMSKKKAVNAKYVVIDIPTGRETKIKTEEGFESLAADFVELGRRLGIKVEAVSTFGEQPVGYGIGPMLEAREALEAVKTGVGHKDLIDKATTLAGVLLEFGGHRNGKKMALDILRSGKAYKKLRGIIEAQGGDPDIKPRSLCETVKIAEIKSNNNGKVLWISNREIAQIAREAGAPKDKVAGVVLCKKIGDKVKRGDTLFEIHSKKTYKFNNALDITKRTEVMKIGKELRMELEEFPHKEEEKRYFILER